MGGLGLDHAHDAATETTVDWHRSIHHDKRIIPHIMPPFSSHSLFALMKSDTDIFPPIFPNLCRLCEIAPGFFFLGESLVTDHRCSIFLKASFRYTKTNFLRAWPHALRGRLGTCHEIGRIISDHVDGESGFDGEFLNALDKVGMILLFEAISSTHFVNP